MNKGIDEHNYNSYHCGKYNRKNNKGSPNSPSNCEDNFYHHNGINGHWTHCRCAI